MKVWHVLVAAAAAVILFFVFNPFRDPPGNKPVEYVIPVPIVEGPYPVAIFQGKEGIVYTVCYQRIWEFDSFDKADELFQYLKQVAYEKREEGRNTRTD